MDGKDVFFLAAASALALDAFGYLPGTPKRAAKKNISGMEVDAPFEEPPPGLEYDNSPPCQLPSVLDSYGLEGDAGYCKPPADLEPKVKTPVPFGAGGDNPQWPVDTEDDTKVLVSYEDVRGKWHGKWGRHFGTTRKSDSGIIRHHVGVDLFADDGDTIKAIEDGEIIAILPYHHGSWAIYIKNDTGDIINYGEIEKNSWSQFGIKRGIGTGQRVSAGQPIAKIGVMSKGSSMLHLEMFRGDTPLDDIRQGKLQWVEGESPNPDILDPTRYLVRAQRGWFNDRMPDGPDVV